MWWNIGKTIYVSHINWAKTFTRRTQSHKLAKLCSCSQKTAPPKKSCVNLRVSYMVDCKCSDKFNFQRFMYITPAITSRSSFFSRFVRITQTRDAANHRASFTSSLLWHTFYIEAACANVGQSQQPNRTASMCVRWSYREYFLVSNNRVLLILALQQIAYKSSFLTDFTRE